ncbi:peptide ABC transporter substrate-binding protein [Stutzerimonas kirkiae]|uniref:Peptide ABC transporter substrate-binding protein n=1 Tax=Stutzerimonas kirkiae TaxID=2211392 RepID=A0A4Q9QX37_9GAMM|nr:ABC transporter substrate-binding protein [Stutzerimonas kirkiae]TBU87986.1 peptide ABC transporter substrate-binding protein [Stutzerimonas kirkiae]TBU98186.1 peptide ABC transporter substrate-binding protein [Stutzerimonas kirkiae]
MLAWLPAASAEPVRGGTLGLVVQPEPPALVHALVSHVSTQYVSGKVLQSLLRFDNALEPVPVLARRWTLGDDRLTWVFDLQEGVKWHDGQPFGADDVVFTLRDFYPAVDPRQRSLNDEFFASIEASGPLQVTLRLKKPFSPLLASLGSGLRPIVARHLYESKGDYRANPVNQQPIGTGPFIFKEWKRGAYIRLGRNPDYWKAGLPYLDAVVFHVIPDAASRAVAFERGDVQVLRSGDADYADLARLAALPGVVRREKGWELFHGQAFLQLNTRKPGLDDARVREAILLSLDRQFIVDNIFFGTGSPAHGVFAPGSPEHDPQLPRHDYNPDRARQLIAESGVDTGKLRLRLLNGEKGGAWERLAEYTRQALQPLGIKVQVVTSDSATWYQRVSDWEFDLTYNFIFQVGDPYLSTSYLYRSDNILKGSPFNNVVGYVNPEADGLWQEAVNAVDEAGRVAAYRRLEGVLNHELPILPIFDMAFPTLHQPQVQNLLRSATSLNDSLEDVFLEEAAR